MKSLLVHIDASPRSAERLGLAQQLARRLGAEVKVVYAVLPALLATPWVAGEGMAGAAAMLADVDRLQLERARASYDHALERGPLGWAEAGSESLLWGVAQLAFYADLVVLGQADAQDAQTGALPGDWVPAVIADSGKPCLVVPYAGSFDAVADKVLVAWKPTPEAARAATAALPLLRLASVICVAHQASGERADEDPCTALEHWLRVHGVTARIEPRRLGAGDVGEALLSLAADTGAGLLVMGCYGHSRAREWVLGGVTRSVLRSMTLPVLMAH
jgi:nucleotide-binding universal stress UspA family protein